MDGLANTFWNKKRVLITGHTGFKGVWLSLWLQALGAKVFGYSRSTPELLSTSEGTFPIESFSGDICEEEKLQHALLTSEAEIVIHTSTCRAINSNCWKRLPPPASLSCWWSSAADRWS